MAALIAALEDDPAVKLRRRLIAGGDRGRRGRQLARRRWQMVSRRRAEAEREIARTCGDGRARRDGGARASAAEARDAARAGVRGVRRAGPRPGRGAVAADARAAAGDRRAATTRPSRPTRRALVLDPARRRASRASSRTCATSTSCSRRTSGWRARRGSSQERLAGGRRGRQPREALAAPGTLALADDARRPRASCSSATNAIRRPAGGSRQRSVRWRPARRRRLPPGSYRLVARAPGLARRRLSVRDRARRAASSVDSTLPPPSAVPEGFVYVPAGRVLVRRRRRAAAHAVPRHGADPPPADRRLPDRAPRDDLRASGSSSWTRCRRRSARATRPTSRRAMRGSLRLREADARLAARRSSRRPSATRRAPASRSSTPGASSARARTGCASRSPASRRADAEALPGLAAQHRARRRARASAPSSSGSAPRAAPTIASIPARRRAATGRRQLRRDLRPRRLGVRAGRGRRRTRPRAARSASTTWPATCSSWRRRRRSRTRSCIRGRRATTSAPRHLPQHQPRAGAADVSRRDHRDSRLRVVVKGKR